MYDELERYPMNLAEEEAEVPATPAGAEEEWADEEEGEKEAVPVEKEEEAI